MGSRTLLSLCTTGLAVILGAAGIAFAVGCGTTAPAPDPIPQALRTTAAATPKARTCEGAPGTVADVAGEPPLWRENTSGRAWITTDGCLARVDVIADYDGPAHCDFQAARFIVTGHPVGTRYSSPGDAHVYVRDPENAFGDERTAGLLDLQATLPSDAADTGLRLGPVQLWAVPDDPERIYVATPGGAIESWPLDRDPTLCA
ncbi:MAG: hypothetical protein QOD86_2613 [Miltoncostaeaceae bacterium]|nr:hypothetical protein [Miltoncostaeaceae bacterium]